MNEIINLLPNDDKPILNRPLGTWEREMFFDCPRRCQILLIAHLKVDNDVDVFKLERAVMFTIYKQPHLRCNINKAADPVDYKPATNFDNVFQTKNIDVWNEDTWEKICYEDLNNDLIYGDDSPLFRCTFVKDNYGFNALMILYHHAIGDGNSGASIVNDILIFYDKIMNNDHFTAEALKPAPCYEIGTKPEFYSNEDMKMIELMKKNKIDRMNNYKPLLPYIVEAEEDNPDYFNRAIHLDGSAENFTQIRLKCKEEKVTVGCFLLASAYFAMSKLHAEISTKNDFVKYEGLKNAFIDFPVSMHGRVDPKLHKDLVAFFITEMSSKIPFINLKTKFWDLCKLLKEQINSKFENKEHTLFSEYNRQLNEEQADLIKSISLGEASDIILNNGGAYPYKLEHSTMQLDKLHMSTSPCIPFFCNYFLIVHSTKIFTYDVVYSGTGEENKAIALKLVNNWKNIAEKSHTFTPETTLEDVLSKNICFT